MSALPHTIIEDADSGPRLQLAAGDAAPRAMLKLVADRLSADRAVHLRFLKSRLRCAEDAEDVLQDVSLKALQGAARLTDPAKVDAWLSVMLRNALFDRYRRNAGRARLQEAVRVEPAVARDEDDDLDLPLACLGAAIRQLKPEAAALIRQAELLDVPLKRLATDLGITANNAGVRVHRARAALRDLMQARCRDCAAPCTLALAAARAA